MKIGKNAWIVGGGIILGGLALLALTRSVIARRDSLPAQALRDRKESLKLASQGEVSALAWSNPEHREMIRRGFDQFRQTQAGMSGVMYGHGYAAGRSPYPHQSAVVDSDAYWHRENPFGAPR